MRGDSTGRRPVVGVMGSGVEGHAARADPLGRWLAAAGVQFLQHRFEPLLLVGGEDFHGGIDLAGTKDTLRRRRPAPTPTPELRDRQSLRVRCSGTAAG